MCVGWGEENGYIYIYAVVDAKKSDVQLEALISQSIIINWELQKNGKYIFFYFFWIKNFLVYWEKNFNFPVGTFEKVKK